MVVCGSRRRNMEASGSRQKSVEAAGSEIWKFNEVYGSSWKYWKPVNTLWKPCGSCTKFVKLLETGGSTQGYVCRSSWKSVLKVVEVYMEGRVSPWNNSVYKLVEIGGSR